MALIRLRKNTYSKPDLMTTSGEVNLLDTMNKSFPELVQAVNVSIILNGREIANTKIMEPEDCAKACDLKIGELDQLDVIAIPAEAVTITQVVIALVAVAASVLLAPTPRTPNNAGQSKTSPNNQLNAATNEFRTYQAIADIAGRRVSYPDFIQPSYYVYENNLKVVKEVFRIGVGHYDVTDVKTSSTLIDNLSGSSYTVHPPGSVPSELVNVRAVNEVDGFVLTAPDDGNLQFSGDCYIDGNTFNSLDGATVCDDLSLEAGDELTISFNGEDSEGTQISFSDDFTVLNVVGSAVFIATPEFFAGEDLTGSATVTKKDQSQARQQWYELEGDEITEVRFQLQMPQGIRGEDQNFISVAVACQVERLNSNGVPTGEVKTETVSFSGNTLDAQYLTGYAEGLTPSRYRARAIRTTITIPSPGVDLVKFERLESVTPYSGADFGDVTLLEVNRRATLQPTSARQSKINAIVTRKLELFDPVTGTFDTGNYTATRSFAQYFMYQAVKRGGLPLSNIDYETLFDIDGSLSSPELGYFDFSFDDEDVPLEERFQTICNVAQVKVFRIFGTRYTFRREEAQPAPVAMFNRRNIIPESDKQTYKFSRSNDFDSVEIKYTDVDEGVSKYVRRKINPATKAIESGRGVRLSKIDYAGCTNLTQATRLADIEIRKIKYLRRRMELTATAEALTLSVGDLVMVSDINDSEIFDGEIIAQDGSVFTTTEVFEPIDGETYYVWITKDDGTVSNSVVATARSDGNKFGFEATGLTAFFADQYEIQLGSRYIIAPTKNVNYQKFIVESRGKPSENYETPLKLVGYDERIFEND